MPLSTEWVKAWAEKYPVAEDEGVETLRGKTSATFGDVEQIVKWKSNRSITYYRRNAATDVERAVTEALANPSDLEALDKLQRLSGIKERVASAILAVLRPEDYTVMDVRAWQSLRAHGLLEAYEHADWRQRWVPYIETCRELAKKLGVSLRTLDRALFAAKGRTELPTSAN